MLLHWVDIFSEIMILIFVWYVLVRPLIRGAVYFPTKSANVDVMMQLLDPEKGRVADLGSGDGRIVIALAKNGIEAHGYEINPLLVIYSKLKIKLSGLDHLAFIHGKSFWKVDFSNFDAVIVYGFPNIMNSLGKKLEKELKPRTKIISNMYQFTDWEYEKKKGGVYQYSTK